MYVPFVSTFRTNEDVHTYTAALVFGVAKNDVTREMRGRAKTVNFGVIYGMGDSALAKQLEEMGKDVQLLVYPNTNHAFFNNTGKNYNAEAAEDAWQRATELLFERLAASWTISGLEITRQKELLGRYRMASAAERRFVRDTIRAHVTEHFPELEAP